MLRITPIRKQMIDLLGHHHLLSAHQLLAFLQQQKASVNKTTVYRSLDALMEEEMICKHSFGGDEAMYELRSHDHDHLVCTVCGNITSTPRSVETPKQIGSFAVDHAHLTYFGTCTQCQ